MTPAANPQTSTPPVTTAWPLKLGVGQSWRAEIQGIGSWNVTFKILDRDGYPQGSAVPSGSGGALEAAFFYFQNDNDMRLKLTSGNTLYRCIFERNEIGGLTFSGWRYVDSADGKSLDKTAQRCNMTFIGRVTLHWRASLRASPVRTRATDELKSRTGHYWLALERRRGSWCCDGR